MSDWKATIVTPPSTYPITSADLRTHLRIDTFDDDAYLSTLIADAVSLAEEMTDSSYMPQTRQVTHYRANAVGFDYASCDYYLPFGPVTSIVSATANGVTVATNQYELRASGYADYCHFLVGTASPVVIQYQCGYSYFPPALRRLLLNVAGYLYENRESHSEKQAYVSDFVDRALDKFKRGILEG